MKKGKTRIGKAFTLCKKGNVGKIKGGISRRSARSVGKYREKQGKLKFGAEKSDVPSKNRPKTDPKRGKAGKTEILERKRWGGLAAKKRALLPILQCYEVAK